jgi:hypothetical protein
MGLLVQANSVHIPLGDKSVQLCCFSPPYWGLRKYAVSPFVWGGRPDCKHKWGKTIKGGEAKTGKRRWQHQRGDDPKGFTSRSKHPDAWIQIDHGQFCEKCGAWYGDLGLEPTPELYIEHMMIIMSEVKRVLRDNGVCFVNIGDSYAGGGGVTGIPEEWDCV